MIDEHLSAWLVLSFTPQLGGVGLSKLLSKDSPINLIDYSHDQLAQLGLKPAQVNYIKQSNHVNVDQCLKWNEIEDHHILTPFDSAYPPLMLQLSSHPPVLFVKGNVDLLSERQIAMVGSRNASMEGLRYAREFASQLAEQGFCITSGLALGIDGHAHDGALQAKGKTVAVLGSGVDVIYPKKHQGLAQRILESQGTLVSELRPDASPRAEFFPRRNRIISGLSLGTLVVEATERSGSLITARYALEQNREVFALPGSISQTGHQGSNRLIQQGALLVQSAQDIIESLSSIGLCYQHSTSKKQADLFSQSAQSKPNNQSSSPPKKIPSKKSSPQKSPPKASKNPQLMTFFTNEPISVDILVERTNISVQELMTQLLELELNGEIMSVSGGYLRYD